MKRLLIFLTTVVFMQPVYSQRTGRGAMSGADTNSISRKWLDIPYAGESPAQKLDIYLPEEGSGPFPVIVSIHGGAFLSGDKADNQLRPMLHGLPRGYAVVFINYRLSGEATFPANIQDVKSAIRWIKANAADYGLDPGRIATWGGSAGGNLASLAGTSAGVTGLEDFSTGNTNVDSRVQAVVDYFGPTDFLTMDEYFRRSGKGKPDHSQPDSPESRVIGQTITEAPELVQMANPATYISPDDPPFMIVHGTDDNTVPVEQSIRFARDLTAVLGDDKVTLKLIEGAGHGGPQFESEEILRLVFDFLDKYLK